jgi:hypothetical protein
MQPGKLIAASFTLAYGAFWVIASAQQTSDPLDACYQLSDVAARVACYDHEVQRRHAAAAGTAPSTSRPSAAPAAPTAAAATAAVPASTPAVAPTTHSAVDDTIGLDGRQLDLRRKQEGIQPVTIKPIVASLARLQQRPGNLYYFELDNGQLWESTDTEPQLFTAPHETVTIRPGALGAFLLKTQEGISIRVHRLR